MSVSGSSVLFAESDPIIRVAVTRLLRGCGLAVTAVATTGEAQALLRASGYDLVLSGLRFSDSDAMEGLRLLSFAGAVPKRPLRVLFTSKLQRSMEAAVRAIGIDRIVVRADGLGPLANTLQALLAEAAGAAKAG